MIPGMYMGELVRVVLERLVVTMIVVHSLRVRSIGAFCYAELGTLIRFVL